ncbi:MAG: proprotein convertase P-domain-containing protein, partial [Saprospiraceae bacterium]
VWTLTIVDDAFGDGGQLQSWSLQICAITLPDLRLNFLQDSFYTCVGENFLTEVSVGEAFNSPVNLTISGYPGITITPASINANQSATISGTMNTPGDYYIVVTANDGTTIISDSVMLHVGQIPSAITTLQTPTNLSTVSPIGLNLTWDAVSGATGYIVEISTDASFATNVFVDSVSSNSVSVSTSLLGNTAYFWRVSVMSECGAGNWSVPFSFITTQVTCTTYTLDSLAIVVGPNPSIATSTIDIPIQGSIVDLNIINLVGTHTFLGDIEIRLTSPNGTTIKLTDNICGSNDNYNVNFDDAAIADPPCPYNDGGTYRPFEALSIFNSQEAIGVWTLTIEDFASGDSGFLNSWGIQICTEPNYNVTIPQNSYSFCIGDSINIPVRVGSAYPGNVNLTMSGYNEVTLSPTTINYVETAHITGLSTTPGTYNLIISGTDGTNSDTTMATIIIGAPPAGIFTLNTPANGATVSQFNPQFSWSAEPNASGYLLEIATNAEFTDVVWAVNVTNTNYVLPIQLQGGAVYFWRLTSINNCGTFISTASTFETSLDLSVAVSPAQLSTCVPFSDTILVQIGEDFNVPVSITIPNAPTGLSYDVIGGVPPGGTATIYLHGTSTALQGNYNLQILVSDNDTSSMSNFVYTLFASAPQPILLSPLNASMFTEGDDLPIFIWNEPSANQILQVSTSPNFSNASIVFRDTLGLVNNYTFVENPFEVDVTYYWRIVPVSSCPVMPSAPYSFTIGASSGVADLAENKFNIYPNPTSDIVQIRFEQPISELTTIQLFDVNGRLLQSKKVDQGSFTTLSLENLTNGVYYLKISTSAWITSKRVILQK